MSTTDRVFLGALLVVLGALLLANVDSYFGRFEEVEGAAIVDAEVTSIHRRKGKDVRITLQAGQVKVSVENESDAKRVGLTQERVESLSFKQIIRCKPSVQRGLTGMPYGDWLLC